MASLTPSLATVRAAFDRLGPPGTPFTTPEIAAEFDCSDRTIYNRLDALVEEGAIETKKVGARGRVWWRPVGDRADDVPDAPERSGSSAPPHAQFPGSTVDNEMADRIRAFEWAETPLGPIDEWPTELHNAVSLMLGADEAIGIYWGDDLTLLYNDPARDVIGVKHPDALGQPARSVFPEAWETLGPIHERVLAGEGPVKHDELLLPIKRSDEVEDSWWDTSYNPIPLADGSIGGVFNIAVDVTDRVRAEQTLSETEHRLQVALNAAEMGTWEWNLDTQMVCADDAMLSLFDLPPTDEPVPVDQFMQNASDAGVAQVEEVPDITFEPGEEIQNDFKLEHLDPPRWISWRGRASDDDPSVLRGVTFDITQRKQAEIERERLLDETEHRYRRLFESIDEGFCIVEVLFDDDEPVDYRFVETNPAFERHTGLTDVEGERMHDLVPDHHDRWSERYGRIARTGEPERFQDQAENLDGRWYDVDAFRIGDPEERTVAILFDDITEQRRTQRALERLTTESRWLMNADAETIPDRVAELTGDVLGVEYAALWRYDDTSGTIREYERHTHSVADLGAVLLPEDFADDVWETFVRDEVDVDDALDVPDTDSTAARLRRRILAPVGRHGVICAGSTEPGAFDERTVNLVETVAATVAAAWDRAESVAALARQNDELAHFERLYSLLWEIDQLLVEADTADAIDEAACERLAASDLYECAWIGDFSADSGTVEPRAWAGIDSTALDDLAAPGDPSAAHENPFAAAVRTGETQVIADIATDPRAGPWRERALERGARSCLGIPLVHDESVYGVLVVYGRSTLHNERDSAVLGDLGKTIAHAIHAVETKVIRQTDSVVELTLQTATADTPLVQLARESGIVIEFRGLVPGTGRDTTVFFTATGADPDEVVAAGEEALAIEELRHLTDRETGSLYKATVVETTLAAQLLDNGSTIRSLTIDEGTATAVVALPETVDVREFVERVRRVVPGLELLARRSQTPSFDTTQHLQTTFEERLTPRQQEVIELAYRSGYFELPRVQTGQELSDALDIAQSTFNYHLRGAERTLLRVLFDQA
ncbi:bacterio-opsin activator domain-containing protein [Halobaculum marinum]|uniref:Bacterio-opsin activator domain-containing protein n=1 Tax=Halobaculum marinum TaxID=3031996 RepID=A0ABD5WW31_9EURY|nr:bacterio-opsin activator domain-containing protein [Halobaculum sp. DT55]